MSNHEEPLTPMKLRERASVTQRQIAATLDVTVGTVSSWERRVKVPHLTLADVKELTDLYKCSVSELIEAFGTIQVRISLNELQGILDWMELPLDGLIHMLEFQGYTSSDDRDS